MFEEEKKAGKKKGGTKGRREGENEMKINPLYYIIAQILFYCFENSDI